MDAGGVNSGLIHLELCLNPKEIKRVRAWKAVNIEKGKGMSCSRVGVCFICLYCSLLWGGAAFAAGEPPVVRDPVDPNGSFFAATSVSPGEYSLLSPEELARRTATADVILIGDNGVSDFPAIEYLLEVMIRAGQKPILGLQSVSTDRQAALDAFHEGKMTPEELVRNLKSSRPDKYARYERLFAVAQKRGVPLHGLSLPYPVMLSAMHGGLEAVPDAERSALPPEIVPPPAEQRAILLEEYARHAAFRGAAPYALPETPVDRVGAEPSAERFIRSVALTDSALGRQAVVVKKEYPGRPLVIAAGDMRILGGYGIASRIRYFAAAEGMPEPKILLIAATRGHARKAGDCDLVFAGDNVLDGMGWEFGAVKGPLRLNDGRLVGDAETPFTAICAVPSAYESQFLPGDVLVALKVERPNLPVGTRNATDLDVPFDPARLAPDGRYPSGEAFIHLVSARLMTPMVPPPTYATVFRQGELVRVWLH